MFRFIFLLFVVGFCFCSNHDSLLVKQINYGNVSLNFVVHENEALSKQSTIFLDTVFLEISGVEMDTFSDTLIYNDSQQASAVIEVLAGTERRFHALAIDSQSGLQYQGETVEDLEAGTEIEVIIDLGILPPPPDPEILLPKNLFNTGCHVK